MDLNKLKNYTVLTAGATIHEQLDKVEEEMNEFEEATLENSREEQIKEGLDVITAMYNYLFMLEITKEQFQEHIEKLNGYISSHKYGGRNDN